MSDQSAFERRFPRRLLLGGGAAAAALAAAEALRPVTADAAPADPWKLGGNTVATDGSAFLGAKNPAPLIFKTTGAGTHTPAERMRITSAGLVGILRPQPTAQLDVLSHTSTAVQGASVATQGVGVAGHGRLHGVRGEVDTDDPISSGVAGVGITGVFGSGKVGVAGATLFTDGRGVTGQGGDYAVEGFGAASAGVLGRSDYIGVQGSGRGWGVYGAATSTDPAFLTFGVFGTAASPSAYAVYADGDLHCAGTLSKAAGSFRIDHPLDPENRWLSHSFVESPDMMNVYNGNVVLGAHGTATVELPAYFEALNRDFRYQLTCIGAHAPVYVASKVADGRFTIAGGTLGLEVSWQVTGIRHDDYAVERPIVVESPKHPAERGTRAFVPVGSTGRRFDPRPQPRAARSSAHR